MTNNNKFRPAVLILCLFLFQTANAQDAHLSQYFANPLYLNPSMTGMYSGTSRVHLHYRSQWRSLTNNPFVTTAVSCDKKVKKIGLGGLIINSKAGKGSLNVLNFVVSGAYDFSIDSAKLHHISIGTQMGLIHKSVNISELTFENQYVSANGGSFDPSIPSGENFYNRSVTLPDFNFGFRYDYTSDKTLTNPFIGISVFHFNEPGESFFGNNNKLPKRYIIDGGVKININRKIQITPLFLFMYELNASEMTTGILTNYYFRQLNAGLIYGIAYRNKDAAIIYLGLKYQNFIYRLSYDVNISSLSPVSRGRGGFELSITYIRSKTPPETKCPRL